MQLATCCVALGWIAWAWAQGTPRTPAPLLIAHRGASSDAPENTLASFRMAFKQGADGIEGDFHMTSDGKIVCIHDATTKRTTDVDLAVAKTTLAELRRLDVGRWKGEAFAGERMPTLDEVLGVVPRDKIVFVELKTGPAIVEPVAAAVARSGFDAERVRIIAFNAETIAASKRTMPRVRAYWITSFKRDEQTGEVTPTLDQMIATLRRIGADGVDMQADSQVVTQAMAARLRGAGYELHCWTINDAAAAERFASLGFDSITTDRPAALREAFDAKAR